MAKRIDRSRIESGKFALPRALGFLTDQKVDFLSLTDRDGDYTVELSAAALRGLVKAKADLKAMKAGQKQTAAGHDAALATEREAHAATQRELASALRKLKKLSPADAAAPAAKKGPATKGGAQATAKKGGARPAVKKGADKPAASSESADTAVSAADVMAAPAA
jgi:hypothetical protein